MSEDGHFPAFIGLFLIDCSPTDDFLRIPSKLCKELELCTCGGAPSSDVFLNCSVCWEGVDNINEQSLQNPCHKLGMARTPQGQNFQAETSVCDFT